MNVLRLLSSLSFLCMVSVHSVFGLRVLLESGKIGVDPAPHRMRSEDRRHMDILSVWRR